MILNELHLKDFRNYEDLVIKDINPNLNLIVGENAQGKTNLIEAIYFLSCGRSFRTATEDRLIRENCKSAYMMTVYETALAKGKIEAALFNNKKRSIKLNGLPVRRMSEIIGRLNTVSFSPEDMKTVKESPSLRRKLMDIEISKLSPSYYVTLQRYFSILKEKNILLKKDKPAYELIDIYNSQLIDEAEKIILKRREFLESINNHSALYYSFLTDNKEKMTLRYRSSADINNIKESLKERIKLNFKRECEQRISLIGPHREDFDIFIDDRDARLMASQGQQRTAMISIKLACAEAAYDFCGERPLLLLDDVFSELDKKRVERLMYSAEKFQVFITSVDIESFQQLKNGKIIKVSEGKIF